MGANRLGNLMEVICGKADLKGNFTNHSGKTTLATRLYQAGVLEQLIMDRTGHRSEKGARAYKRPSETMLKDVLNPSSSVKKRNVRHILVLVRRMKKMIQDRPNILKILV